MLLNNRLKICLVTFPKQNFNIVGSNEFLKDGIFEDDYLFKNTIDVLGDLKCPFYYCAQNTFIEL